MTRVAAKEAVTEVVVVAVAVVAIVAVAAVVAAAMAAAEATEAVAAAAVAAVEAAVELDAVEAEMVTDGLTMDTMDVCPFLVRQDIKFRNLMVLLLIAIMFITLGMKIVQLAMGKFVNWKGFPKFTGNYSSCLPFHSAMEHKMEAKARRMGKIVIKVVVAQTQEQANPVRAVCQVRKTVPC
jgi:hypothetical protein